MKEFLPKYAGIEYFFTGIFVEKLLWKEEPIDEETIENELEELKTHDIQVEDL